MSPADLISGVAGDQMNLPHRDSTWLALRAVWLDTTIDGIGSVRIARATVRREQFPQIPNTDVIVAIRDEPGTLKTLLTFATTDVSAVLRGGEIPILTLYPGGVDLVAIDDYYGWAIGEAIWSEYHDTELASLVPVNEIYRIADSWTRLSLPGWQLSDRAAMLSVCCRGETEAGDVVIVEVEATKINIYIGDCFFEPQLNQDYLAASVPACAPEKEVLKRYLPAKVANEARLVMRWYRRTIYELILEEARAGRI